VSGVCRVAAPVRRPAQGKKYICGFEETILLSEADQLHVSRDVTTSSEIAKHKVINASRARKWLAVLLPFVVGLIGSEVYSSAPDGSESWGSLLGSLYYVPVVVAAIVMGTQAALIVAASAGAFHTLAAVVGRGDPYVGPIAQAVLFVCVGLTAARLAQWRRDTVSTRSQHLSIESLSTGEATKAWETSFARRVIAGLIGHFRTPVTSIEGAGWVLNDPHLPEEKRRELVGIVRKEAHRLSRVLSDVVEFIQPRPPVFQTINVSKLVDDAIQLAGSRDHGRSHVFRKIIAPDLPSLRGDPEQIRQVLLNLVMNSIQATPFGGHIEVSAQIEQDHFLITVTDEGRGISPATLDKIFDPFFTTHEQQLGLGLPVALRIVTEHGGKIGVDCNRSEGTRVSVVLPKGSG
jgi:signal transduction histidine kinase